MPDLKSELEKVLHSWEQPTIEETMTETPAPSTNPYPTFSEATYHYICKYPGVDAQTLAIYLRSIGASQPASTALPFSLMERKLVEKRGKQYYPVADHYPTKEEMNKKRLAGVKKARAAAARKLMLKLARDKAKRAKAKGNAQKVQAPEVEIEPIVPEIPMAPASRTVEDMLASMNVLQAREMYTKLKEIFG